jgi:5-methylcytosine-specific restriction endonuclease McrBC GTP-binding regulatory subunit McrB
MCAFVQGVADVLDKQGVAVRDLIDAQSFIWISHQRSKNPPKEAAAKTPPPIVTREPEPDLEVVAKDLAEATLWPLDRARHLVNLTQRSGQLLFQGPPGTGKTFVAEKLARLLAGNEDGRVELVQFHPSYAYEDFVEGIRPVVTEGRGLAYEVREGLFLRLAGLAREHREDRFFLVIDELNRANLPRVFGELLYALEYRGPEHTFRLPYSEGEAYIPANITIVATMNTADRSIALVDAAIRRRFRHVDFRPEPALLRSWLQAHDLGTIAEHAADRLIALNKALQELVTADCLIGHTYLMRPDLGEVGLKGVWEEDVEPVLREHLFRQPDEIVKLREIFLTLQ